MTHAMSWIARPRIAATALVCLTLAACGGRVPLRPPPGGSMPPKAAAADEPPTMEELLQPSAQARPERNAELLTRSVERTDDEFDLPPGKDN